MEEHDATDPSPTDPKKPRRRRDPEALQSITETIAERLHGVRVRLGWSQQQVAESLSVTQAAVSRWENRSHSAVPSAAELAVLADVFGVSADWLCGRSEFEQALPAGQAVVDAPMLDALLATDELEDLRRLIDEELSFGNVYSTIPKGAALLDHAEAKKRVDRVDRHLRAIDEELWRKWARSVLG